MSNIPTIASYLYNSSNNLGELLRHVQRLQRLTALLRDALPAPLKDHCCVANLRDGILILHADTPVWAHQLRYHLPQVLQHVALNERLEPLQGRVKIQPASFIRL